MRIRNLKRRGQSTTGGEDGTDSTEASEGQILVHREEGTAGSGMLRSIPDETENSNLTHGNLQHFNRSRRSSHGIDEEKVQNRDDYIEPGLGGYTPNSVPSTKLEASRSRETRFHGNPTMAGRIPVFELTDETEFGYVNGLDIQDDDGENEADDEWECLGLAVEGTACPRRIVKSANITRPRRLESTNIMEELRSANLIKGSRNRCLRQSLGGVAWEIFITGSDRPSPLFTAPKPPSQLDTLDVEKEKLKLRAQQAESKLNRCPKVSTNKGKKTKKANKGKKKDKQARKSELQVLENYSRQQQAKESLAPSRQLDRDNPTPTMDFWGHRSQTKVRPVSRVKGVVQPPSSLSDTDVVVQLPVLAAADSVRKAMSHPTRVTSPESPVEESPSDVVIDMKQSESSLYRTASDGSDSDGGRGSPLLDEAAECSIRRYEKEMLEADDFLPLSPETASGVESKN